MLPNHSRSPSSISLPPKFASRKITTTNNIRRFSNFSKVITRTVSSVLPLRQCVATTYANSSMPDSEGNSPTESSGGNLQGWLLKWTNYIKGYQKRWFVLNEGILSYYRNAAEMKYTCRGTVYMSNATILSIDPLHFVIKNGSATIHLKTNTEADKLRWIAALELAKSKAVKFESISIEDNEEAIADSNIRSMDPFAVDKQLNQKLEELEACFDLIRKQQQALQRSVNSSAVQQGTIDQSVINALDERVTIFRITSTSLINNCRAFLSIARKQRQVYYKAYTDERELRLRLEEVVEKMARQQNMLEKNFLRAGKTGESTGQHQPMTSNEVHPNTSPSKEDDENDVFHDALDQDLLRMPLGSMMDERGDAVPDSARFDYEYDSSEEDEYDEYGQKQQSASVLIRMAHSPVDDDKSLTSKEVESTAVSKRIRRTSIPLRPEYSLNLWSIIKNCVGKDLSRIPVPVNFSEPLSMLQRLTEELEYSDLLDKASKCTDTCKQMAYVAAFTISVYSTTADRAAKPFNPLLGETYECDRTDDLGWKSIAEQVSHHPPSLANFAEGKTWQLWQEFTMTSKFRGQYLSITPLGFSHLYFPESGNHYTWKKVTTCVQNIIIGKLWIDNVGEMDILNHVTKDKCHIKFFEHSMFSRESPRKVGGIITDKNRVARWIISGKWNDMIEAAEVKNPVVVSPVARLETHNPIVLWKRKYPPAYLSRMYNFTTLAVQLNEEEEGVAPTDSRLRPDQRLMEEGRWDEANQEKLRLEEKQRDVRRKLEEENQKRLERGEEPLCHKPAWFKKQHDEYTDSDVHVFTHEYWQCKEKQDWSRCPDIF